MGTTRSERQPHPLKSYINFYRGVICGMGLQHGEDKLCAPGSRLQENEFQNHVNFEQYVVLMSQLRRAKSYEFEYSSLLWCYYLWVGKLLPKGYVECLSMDIKAKYFFETSVNITVDMANYKLDVCVTVHHWYNNINNQLDATISINSVSSTCFGR